VAGGAGRLPGKIPARPQCSLGVFIHLADTAQTPRKDETRQRRGPFRRGKAIPLPPETGPGAYSARASGSRTKARCQMQSRRAVLARFKVVGYQNGANCRKGVPRVARSTGGLRSSARAHPPDSMFVTNAESPSAHVTCPYTAPIYRCRSTDARKETENNRLLAGTSPKKGRDGT